MTDPDALILTVQGLELPIAPPFTNRELHLVKQIAGVRAGELGDALEHRDNDVIVALAHIALRRAGRTRPTLEELWEMPAGEIDVGVPEDLEDAGPDPTPAGAPADAASNGNPETLPRSPGSPSTVTS